MSSPVRSVAVRLSMDPASYIAGASRAEASTLSLDRAVSKVGGSATTSMEAAAKGAGTAESALGKLNKTAGALGLTMGGLAGVGAAVAVGLSIKWAGDYQSALTRLSTTAGESQGNLKMVGQGMLDMAGQVGIGAQELAKGMYTVDSAGIHGADSLTVLKAAAQGARQENADLSHVVDAVTTSLHDYHLPASQAATVTSQLIAAVSHGKTTFDELTGAMHSVEPIAASAGMSIAQTAGALAAMTASGMHADQAAQNLASSIRSFEKPTGTMRDELYQLGLDAQDLSAHLGDRGIAGTLQMVSDAIVKKMGPSGLVALDALNKNKAAAQDLGIMMSNLPPDVQKLAQGLLDGTTSQKEFTLAAKGLGGQAGPMADQFLALYKSSDGFSQILKTGGPAVQTYMGALGKSVGTAEGLSVALQLTGENADGANKAIGAVAKAAADAHGNVQGWDEVQKNFNQRLAEAEKGLESLATEAGQHLLPALSGALGYITRDVIPGIEHLGHGVGDVAHGFSELPGPVRDFALALGGLALADKIGLLDKLGAGAGRVGGVFSSMSGQITTAFSMAKANQVRMVGESAALWGQAGAASRAAAGENAGLWASAATEVEKAGTVIRGSTGNVAGLGAAAGAAARGGLTALKSAGSGLMSMFGGPWGLAIAGAVLGISALTSMNNQLDEQLKKNTDDVAKWYKTLALGGSTGDVIKAQQQLDGYRKQLADVTDKINAYNAAAQGGNARGGIGTLVTQQAELRTELDKGKKAWDAQLAGMTPVELATARLSSAEAQLADARKQYPANSQIVIAAEAEVATAQHNVAGETDNATRAQKSQIQTMQDAANAALGQIDAQRALEQAQLNLGDAIARYNTDVASGTLTSSQLRQEQLGLVDSAESVAKAAGDAAAKQAAANGATDTGAASQAAFIKSLQDTADKLNGPAKQAVEDMITALGATQTQASLTAGAINGLGVTVIGLPNEHMITIDAPTDKQMKDLHELGYATATLPDGKIVVSADTNPAQTAIMDLLNYARTQSILYRATLPDLNGSASGSGRPGMATGGWVRGPGTGTSDEVPIMGSNGEFMVKAKAAARHATLLEAINSDRVPGFAQGGWINVPPGGAYMGSASIPVSVDGSAYKSSIHGYLAAAAAAAAVGPTGLGGSIVKSGIQAIVRGMAAARGWGDGAEWNSLAAVINRESGWNPSAANPTSSARGLFQKMTSINGPIEPTVQGQTNWGLNYIGGRYHDPIGAWAHEAKFGWYDQGGPLYPGLTLVANGTGQTETVRTAGQEQTVQRQLRTREMSGASFGGAVVQHTDARSYPLAVTAGPDTASIVRQVRDAQRDLEFLHG